MHAENLLMEFEKLQTLMEADLSYYSKLGCLPYSIVHLSQLNIFQLNEFFKLEILFENFKT